MANKKFALQANLLPGKRSETEARDVAIKHAREEAAALVKARAEDGPTVDEISDALYGAWYPYYYWYVPATAGDSALLSTIANFILPNSARGCLVPDVIGALSRMRSLLSGS